MCSSHSHRLCCSTVAAAALPFDIRIRIRTHLPLKYIDFPVFDFDMVPKFL